MTLHNFHEQLVDVVAQECNTNAELDTAAIAKYGGNFAYFRQQLHASCPPRLLLHSCQLQTLNCMMKMQIGQHHDDAMSAGDTASPPAITSQHIYVNYRHEVLSATNRSQNADLNMCVSQ